MKKFLLSVLAVLTVMSFVGCNDTPNQNYDAESNLKRINSQYFDTEIIEDLGGGCFVLRDKNTDILYLCVGGYKSAMMTPIYNEDGTIKKYSEELKKEKGDN